MNNKLSINTQPHIINWRNITIDLTIIIIDNRFRLLFDYSYFIDESKFY